MRCSLIFSWLFVMSLILAACVPTGAPQVLPSTATPDSAASTIEPLRTASPTDLPSRPPYAPGELVDYQAQPGDTLPALAVHFNTSVKEILAANTFIPGNVTTLPPGMPMRIPIYYAPFWGPAYQMIPDSLFVNGPAQVGFDLAGFISASPGWIKSYQAYAADENRSGAEIIELVGRNFSLSPRLLLALLEYQAGAISQSSPPEDEDYLLGKQDWQRKGLYLQLVWAANTLNNGYYGWRTGSLGIFEHLDGRQERPDPWQNAASVALQYYFSRTMPREQYLKAVNPDGFAKTYHSLFGDPWQAQQPHIPGSLEQPILSLPFEPGLTWAFTGGPHTAWGDGEPLAAVDFAPGSNISGCYNTDEWATAAAPGVVARSESAAVVLDLDGDGDERTGWNVFYFHLASTEKAQVGQLLHFRDPVGHPSCEGGRATGTHVHIARKYNGEWVPAAGPLAFNLDGWIVQNGERPYLGYLIRNTQKITACDCADQASQLQAEMK